MIPTDTPYKIIKYLVNLSQEKVLQKNYKTNRFIIYLIDRGYIVEPNNDQTKFTTTELFNNRYSQEVLSVFRKYDSFIKMHQVEYIENYCLISDLNNLILIDADKPQNLSLQEILSKYFKSSKHTQPNSSIAKAIKKVLQIEEFAEDSKDQQYLSILYPKNKAKFIVLCENKNRLRNPRHDFIEFWYAGGKNTKQLQFIPKRKQPIYYLFDWDYEGVNIYIDIKQNYIPNLKAFLPFKHELLMVKQEDVKDHKTKWKNDIFLQYLTESERIIASTLMHSPGWIIVEQKILFTRETLLFNNII